MFGWGKKKKKKQQNNTVEPIKKPAPTVKLNASELNITANDQKTKLARRSPRLTAEEDQSLKATFQFFDTDKSGYITRNELEEVVKRFGDAGCVSPSIDMNLMVEQFKADNRNSPGVHSPRISYDEFVTVMESKMSTQDFVVEDSFNLFDQNGDGKISYKELKNMLMKFDGTMTDAQCRDLFNGADTNNDGFIDLNEFKTLMLSV